MSQIIIIKVDLSGFFWSPWAYDIFCVYERSTSVELGGKYSLRLSSLE